MFVGKLSAKFSSSKNDVVGIVEICLQNRGGAKKIAMSSSAQHVYIFKCSCLWFVIPLFHWLYHILPRIVVHLFFPLNFSAQSVKRKRKWRVCQRTKSLKLICHLRFSYKRKVFNERFEVFKEFAHHKHRQSGNRL